MFPRIFKALNEILFPNLRILFDYYKQIIFLIAVRSLKRSVLVTKPLQRYSVLNKTFKL